MPTELSELLIKLRSQNTLRDIANRTGISHTYLALLEKGTDPRTEKPIQLSVSVLRKLADAYNYPFEKLMAAAGYSPKESGEDQSGEWPEMLSFIRQAAPLLTEEEKENLLEFGKTFFQQVLKSRQRQENKNKK